MGFPSALPTASGVSFAIPLQRAVEAAMHMDTQTEYAFQLFFHERIPLFQHQNLITRFDELLDLFLWQRILANLQNRMREAFGIVFRQIVESNPGCDNTQPFVRPVKILVVNRFF